MLGWEDSEDDLPGPLCLESWILCLRSFLGGPGGVSDGWSCCQVCRDVLGRGRGAVQALTWLGRLAHPEWHL